MAFSVLYKALTLATLLMIIHLYLIENNFKEIKTILKKKFELLKVWFSKKHIVLNPENANK